MTSNVTAIFQPDETAMLRHLEHLFGGTLDGRHEGLIEIGWRDERDGKLRHGQLFGTDKLEEAAAFAAKTNAAPGRNVYVGGALRHPDTAPFVRSNDEDAWASLAVWADLDDDGAADEVRHKYRGCPPTCVVVTGRVPHKRAQLWWRFTEALDDMAALRAQLVELARALDGDSTVTNPSRVMRLGGSIAWPVKDGRIVERTELILPPDRPLYIPGQIARAFPPAAGLLDAAQASPPIAATPAAQNAPTPPPAGTAAPANAPVRSTITGLISPAAALAKIRAGEQWHNHMIQLVGHWVGRGWTDTEILGQAAGITLPGYTVADTAREMRQAIDGARRKLSRPNMEVEFDAETGEVAGSPSAFPVLTDWTASAYDGDAPPIRWLCEGSIPLGAPVLFAAMGGLGKSFLALDMALEVAIAAATVSPRKLLGGQIVEHGSAVVISAEDSRASIHRRLEGIDPQRRRAKAPHRLMVVPLPDAGGPMPLIAADRSGALSKTPAFDALRRQLLEVKDLRLVIIDPLQAFVMADVNADPAAGQFMWSAFAEICAQTGATLIVCHHMRKDGMSNVRSPEDAREMIRGSTALVDGARATYALWREGEDDAKRICAQLGCEYQRGRVVNGAVVKANDLANLEVQRYLRMPSGLLVDHTEEIDAARDMPPVGKREAVTILEEVNRRFEAGAAVKRGENAGRDWVGTLVMEMAKVGRKEARDMVEAWWRNGVLEEVTLDSRTKAKGLKGRVEALADGPG
ncbi:MAG: AAA family ATPase [Burkholderiales bacterium]|nr:AAA family ATPase [Burkholderiales bacterium]